MFHISEKSSYRITLPKFISVQKLNIEFVILQYLYNVFYFCLQFNMYLYYCIILKVIMEKAVF